jgi:hypothetical protein
VVIGAAGRIEVDAAIPPPDGVSPDGPHTHVLPRLLRLGRVLGPRLELPPGWAPAACFHPAPGTAVILD